MYSFKISFCIVPLNLDWSTPCDLAVAIYIANIIAAVALIVMDVLTWSIGIPLNKSCMSRTLQIGTPTLPTSPLAKGLSES